MIVTPAHELLDGRPLTLERLAEHPIITYNAGFTGRLHIDAAFAKAGLEPDPVLTAMDADVIKTCVGRGPGVGIVASIAYDEERDWGCVPLCRSSLRGQPREARRAPR